MGMLIPVKMSVILRPLLEIRSRTIIIAYNQGGRHMYCRTIGRDFFYRTISMRRIHYRIKSILSTGGSISISPAPET